MIEEFQKNGFLLKKNFFSKDTVNEILNDAKNVFRKQFVHKQVTYEKNLFQLFENNIEIFSNCGKHIQHLPSLHRLGLSSKIFTVLEGLGFQFPCISTRPVLFFNHEKLAKEDIYHTVPPHQDWASMQGSLDSIVVWLPLVDIDKSLGALKVAPGSHKAGLQATQEFKSFGLVDASNYKFIDVEVEAGDALFFSSFLVHQSGRNTSNKIRWSCHFRYNNLNDKDFISRGYPHPYIYKVSNCKLTELPNLSQ